MTWQDRLKEAAYTSPSGTRQRFDYLDLSYDFDKRTAGFEFPGVDGVYVQDNGRSGRRYPLICIFSGPDCDRLARAFEALLSERGAGKLDHPLYGRVDVVPFGQMTRRDDVLTAANQTAWEVVFWETTGAVYPSSRVSPKFEVIQSITTTQAALSRGFSKSMNLGTEARRVNAKITVTSVLRDIQSALKTASNAVESVNREFRDLQQAINFGIDVLIGQPLQLAQQMLNLITAPSRALTGIGSRLQGYSDLLDRMLARSKSSPGDTSVLDSIQLRLSTDFHTADLVGSGAVLGDVSSVVNNQFTAKPQALEAAEAILADAERLTGWRDGRFSDLEQIDTGEGSQALQETVALCVGYLIEISFSLVPEKAVVLDRPRNIIELSAELYGSIDDRLDFLISTNHLTGSEILELPRGKRVVYYA